MQQQQQASGDDYDHPDFRSVILERTMSDVYNDELYSPSFTYTSAPSTKVLMPQPQSAVLSRILQATFERSVDAPSRRSRAGSENRIPRRITFSTFKKQLWFSTNEIRQLHFTTANAKDNRVIGGRFHRNNRHHHIQHNRASHLLHRQFQVEYVPLSTFVPQQPRQNSHQLSLQKHRREHHSQSAPLAGASPMVAAASQAGPHKCTRISPQTGKPCNVIFSRPYDLTRHEDTIHNTRKTKTRCPLFKKTFSRSDALTRHRRSHPNHKAKSTQPRD